MKKRSELRIEFESFKQELKESTAAIRQAFKDQELRITNLESQVRVLQECSDEYLELRNTFLITYERERTEQVCREQDGSVFGSGNVVASNGDAYADALVMKAGLYTNRLVYKELYGFSDLEALEYSMSCIKTDTTTYNTTSKLIFHL